MRERPILFSGAMVKAILDGRKTMTRRVLRPQPPADSRFSATTTEGRQSNTWMRFFNVDDCATEHCPYGSPGDRLWVRETFVALDRAHYDDPGKPRDLLSSRYGSPRRNGCAYRAECDAEGDEIRKEYGYLWRPSIFMPRWASRITLEVEAVRVERVQEISESDIIAEGCPPEYLLGRNWWIPGWDSLNAKRGFGWDANPFVWVVTFKRVETQDGR